MATEKQSLLGERTQEALEVCRDTLKKLKVEFDFADAHLDIFEQQQRIHSDITLKIEMIVGKVPPQKNYAEALRKKLTDHTELLGSLQEIIATLSDVAPCRKEAMDMQLLLGELKYRNTQRMKIPIT